MIEVGCESPAIVIRRGEMKVYYDKEHDACAVEFDKEDGMSINVSEDGGIWIDSFKGGKPEIIERQLRFSLDEVKE